MRLPGLLAQDSSFAQAPDPIVIPDYGSQLNWLAAALIVSAAILAAGGIISSWILANRREK